MRYRFRFAALAIPLLMGLLSLESCSQPNRAIDQLSKNSQQIQDFDNSLTFNSVTLEEFDGKGRLWWRVKAKQASYSRDKKVARITQPNGEFFQDGKGILLVSAKSGEVQQDGQKIFLRGQIVATDTRDGLVLRGNELEWQPRNDLLIVRDNVTGTHRQVKLAAKQGQFFSRARRLELQGQVTANATQPALLFKSDRLVWQISQQTLTTDRPLQLERTVSQTARDRATANEGVVSLSEKTATLKQSAQVTFAKPALQVASNALIWSLSDQTIVSSQPLTLVDREQQITLNANQGRLDLGTNLASLTGNVRGVGDRNKTQIQSDRLNWNLSSRQFDAEGDVVYQQANPALNLTGPRAAGRLQDQNVVVSGGRVVTEFIP